jgi:hypothetical protein
MPNRTVDFKLRTALIMAGGLPCRIRCRSDGFTRLDLEPMPGWVHLADDSTVAEYLAQGWHYHVPLCTWSVDEGTWSRIVDGWDGVEITIKIQYVNDNGGAVLAWTDLGADPDMWELYMSGSYGHKWRDSGHGLHISM